MESITSCIYWIEGGSSKLCDFPWKEMQEKELTVTNEPCTWENLDMSKIEERIKTVNLAVFLLEIDKKEQIKKIEKEILPKINSQTLLLALTPALWLNDVEKILKGKENCSSLQKPIRKPELFLLLKNTILLEFYKLKTEAIARDEMSWLSKLEKVFEFFRQEMLDKERTSVAYEQLVEYENKLLEEQRRINQALLSLQEFRDLEEKQWLKERQAREQVEQLYVDELKTKDQTLRAQESLLEFNRAEKIALNNLLREFKAKGTLSPDNIQMLIEGHEKLLAELENFIQTS